MEWSMKYQKINKSDICNGPNVRVSLFVSGCSIRCKGCFNAEAWDFNCGKEFTTDTIVEILNYLEPNYINGFSLLGGEPFDQDPDLLVDLLEQIKSKYPEKDIWCWTGYEFEQIKNKELLNYIDVIICGKFEIDKRDISSNNKWRGSTNQYIVDVKSSLNSNELILYKEN